MPALMGWAGLLPSEAVSHALPLLQPRGVVALLAGRGLWMPRHSPYLFVLMVFSLWVCV